MAEKAYLYYEDGTRKMVSARDCTEQDKGKDYRCCGWHRGRECLAPLELRIGSKHQNYFAVKAGYKHLSGCPNDETQPRTRKVTVVDPEGRNCTPHSLYELFKSKGSSSRTGGGKRDNGETHNEVDPDDEEDDEDILPAEDEEQVLKAPTKFSQMVTRLLRMDPEDTYAETLVSKQFCDHKTVAKYRKADFPGSGIMTVVGWKTYPPTGYRVAAGEFVLAIDGTRGDKLYLSFRADNDVLENLRKEENKRFVVMNCWKRERKFKNVFRGADIVTRHLIYMFE